MANELQLLPNPTNIPEAVSTGYQRQNTNIFVLQTGLDTTEPYDDNNTGVITIPGGGIVELNGSLFKLTSDVTLQKPNANTAYWIAVIDNGDGTANLSLVIRPGKWNPEKKGCYKTDGSRTLNWVSFGILNNLTETAVFSKNTKGTETHILQKSWYYADLRSGLGGSNGGNGGNGGNGSANSNGTSGAGGGGGIASNYKSIQKIFFIEKQQTITVKAGGNGWNGGSGGTNSSLFAYVTGAPGGGGGGASGTGEESSIFELNINTGETQNGNGGNGGRGGNGVDGRTSNFDIHGGGGSGGGGGGGFIGGNAGSGGTGSPGGGTNGISGSGGGSVIGGVGTDMYGGDGGSGGGGNGGSAGKNNNGNNASNGVGGGGMGSHGRHRPDGSTAAGYCNIYKLED
jgi:hypothetical protein